MLPIKEWLEDREGEKPLGVFGEWACSHAQGGCRGLHASVELMGANNGVACHNALGVDMPHVARRREAREAERRGSAGTGAFLTVSLLLCPTLLYCSHLRRERQGAVRLLFAQPCHSREGEWPMQLHSTSTGRDFFDGPAACAAHVKECTAAAASPSLHSPLTLTPPTPLAIPTPAQTAQSRVGTERAAGVRAMVFANKAMATREVGGGSRVWHAWQEHQGQQGAHSPRRRWGGGQGWLLPPARCEGWA